MAEKARDFPVMFSDGGKFYVDYLGERHEFNSRWFAEQCVSDLRLMAERKQEERAE